MKKVLLLKMFLLLVFLAAACRGDKSPHLYDERSLVPQECAYLDNIDDWQPVWCDEFAVDGLPDSTKWSYDVGGHGWGNHELQYYTNANLNNAFIEDGILHIRAIRESLGSNPYTSARLVSKYRGDWLYGRIQVKAKMPTGRGTWPAIWMLPTDWVYGGWPNSGEIDIMEYVGYQPGIVHGTIHTGAYNHMLNTDIGYSRSLPTAETEFHLYEMIWEPNRIELFIDGERFAIFGYNPDTNIDIKNSDAWPFDQRFHLILNLAVGGTWGGVQGVDESAFPTQMEIEYVRVYQKDYAGMDQESPAAPTNLTLQRTTHNSARIKWTHAVDDVMVKQYNVYVDGTQVGQTTVNAYHVTGLTANTTHLVELEAEDFKGQTSARTPITVETEPVRLATDRIRAANYDAMQGIILQATEDVGGGNNVGWIDAGDWLEYILEVPESGTYRVHYRVASLAGGGEIRLTSRSHLPHAITLVDATGGWQDWTTITSTTFTLQEGVFTFRVTAASGGFNLNYIEFEKVE